MESFIVRADSGALLLSIVPPCSSPPDYASHAENIRRIQRLEPHLRRYVVASDGDDIWVSLVQGISNKVAERTGLRTRMNVARSIEDGLARLAEAAGPSTPPTGVLRSEIASLSESVGAATLDDPRVRLRSRRLAAFFRERGLTVAEAQVAELVGRGLANKEVAQALGRSSSTVRNQLACVFRKVGVASRTELAARLGLLEPAQGRGPLIPTEPNGGHDGSEDQGGD